MSKIEAKDIIPSNKTHSSASNRPLSAPLLAVPSSLLALLLLLVHGVELVREGIRELEARLLKVHMVAAVRRQQILRAQHQVMAVMRWRSRTDLSGHDRDDRQNAKNAETWVYQDSQWPASGF